MPVATAAAEPPLEPPAVRPVSHGLRVRAEQVGLGAGAEAELRRVGLAEDHQARPAEAPRVLGVVVRHVVRKDSGAGGVGRARAMGSQILKQEGHARERALRGGAAPRGPRRTSCG